MPSAELCARCQRLRACRARVGARCTTARTWNALANASLARGQPENLRKLGCHARGPELPQQTSLFPTGQIGKVALRVDSLDPSVHLSTAWRAHGPRPAVAPTSRAMIAVQNAWTRKLWSGAFAEPFRNVHSAMLLSEKNTTCFPCISSAHVDRHKHWASISSAAICWSSLPTRFLQ